jgi:hypothetical protein
MAEPTTEDVAPDRCWCCGEARPEADLVRLGDHPEVGICTECARWVHRRAATQNHSGRTSLAGIGRSAVNAVRNRVIGLGLQDRRVIGPLLRRLDRYLP